MSEYRSSLDIALNPFDNGGVGKEPVGERFRSSPLGYNENLLATRGLSSHLTKLHSAKLETGMRPENALLAVYDFFYDDYDRYRNRTEAVIDILVPGPENFALTATAIAVIKTAQEARQSGIWPGNHRYNAKLTATYQNLIAQREQLQVEAWNDALAAALGNRRYLLTQLLGVQTHPLVIDIANGISGSVIEDEVPAGHRS